MKHFSVKLSILLAAIVQLNASAQSNESCKQEQAALNAINTKYQSSYNAISERGNDLGKQAPSNEDRLRFNVKMEMKEQRWVIKLPSVTMARNEVVLGLPQTTMKTQNWSYDFPETRMERRKTGQIPEFTCSKDNWGIPYDCRVKWTDTFADVPVTTMERREIKLDIPEISWSDTRFSWDIPQLTWVENVWVLQVPEFKLINVAVEQGKDLEQKSDLLGKDIALINSQRNSDSRSSSNALYACFRGDMSSQQAAMEAEMDKGITALTSSIEAIRAQGADPTKVPSSGAQAVDLVAKLAEMVTNRKAATASFLDARAALDTAEKNGLAQLQSL